MKVAFALFVAVAALWASGCVVIPTNYHAAGSRQNLSHDEEQKLQVGATTKRDVLLMLGEPEYAAPDGKVLRYDWQKVKAIWAAGAYYSGAMGAVEREYSLELTFDERNVLAKREVLKHWDLAGEAGHRKKTANPNDITLERQSFGEVSARVVVGVGVQVKAVRDLRAEKDRIGYRTAAMNVSLGNVYLAETVEDYFRRRLSHELMQQGFRLEETEAEASIELGVKRFWVYTNTTLTYFDMIAEVECDAEIVNWRGEQEKHVFRSSKKDRTYIYPTKKLMTETLNAAVDEVMGELVGEVKKVLGK
jgi:outer membrane protein assembly factor BamE (lipoprotein component of BamABCDE complex)